MTGTVQIDQATWQRARREAEEASRQLGEFCRHLRKWNKSLDPNDTKLAHTALVGAATNLKPAFEIAFTNTDHLLPGTQENVKRAWVSIEKGLHQLAFNFANLANNPGSLANETRDSSVEVLIRQTQKLDLQVRRFSQGVLDLNGRRNFIDGMVAHWFGSDVSDNPQVTTAFQCDPAEWESLTAAMRLMDQDAHAYMHHLHDPNQGELRRIKEEGLHLEDAFFGLEERLLADVTAVGPNSQRAARAWITLIEESLADFVDNPSHRGDNAELSLLGQLDRLTEAVNYAAIGLFHITESLQREWHKTLEVNSPVRTVNADKALTTV